jgi:hypothetical protein
MAAPKSVFENFTDKSRRTVVLAEKQARMLGHNVSDGSVGSCHVSPTWLAPAAQDSSAACARRPASSAAALIIGQ